MDFKPIPRVSEDQPLWGARAGRFTFVISQDQPSGFTASAKDHGSVPFERIELGGYCAHKSFVAAVVACERFWSENRAIHLERGPNSSSK
jgi:hypothetical protein